MDWERLMTFIFLKISLRISIGSWQRQREATDDDIEDVSWLGSAPIQQYDHQLLITPHMMFAR